MNHESKKIFSIGKFKTGTYSALLAKYGIALAAATVLMGAATVSADETTATPVQPATELVAPAVPKVATPENTPVQVQSEVKSDIPTAVPANATQEQAVKAVDGAQATLKDSVSSAKEAGVAVKEGDTKEVVISDGNASEKTSEVLTDLNKQDQAVKEAQAKQEANQKAYEETSANREKAVKDGQSSLSASTKEVDQLMEQAKKAGLLVTETTTDKTPNYKETKGLTGDALRKVMAENVALYKEAIKAGIALQNKSVEDLKRDLALYQANQKAYTQANTAHKDAKSAGVADLELANGRQNQVVDLAKKNGVAIATKTETTSPTYTPVARLEGDALLKAIE